MRQHLPVLARGGRLDDEADGLRGGGGGRLFGIAAAGRDGAAAGQHQARGDGPRVQRGDAPAIDLLHLVVPSVARRSDGATASPRRCGGSIGSAQRAHIAPRADPAYAGRAIA
jgi:hypothetical protein